MYSLPWWGVNVAANSQFRQGYPFPAAIQVTNRGGGLGTATVLLPALQRAFGELVDSGLGDRDIAVTRRFVAERRSGTDHESPCGATAFTCG